jgi:hypothetical protein
MAENYAYVTIRLRSRIWSRLREKLIGLEPCKTVEKCAKCLFTLLLCPDEVKAMTPMA